MVVNRHWSFDDLRRLYEMAEHEGPDDPRGPNGSPPPSYEAVEHPGGDQRLAIEPSPLDSDQSKAIVKYHAMPLNQLDAKMTNAMALPNKVLAQPDVNVVDHLLAEWTHVKEFERRRQKRREKYSAHYQTDESDTSSDDEYDQSMRKGGHHLEGPNGTHMPRNSVKNVHFRARVESDNEDSDKATPRNGRTPSRYVLRSDSSSSSSHSPPPHLRRSSDSSTRFRPAPADLTDRTRRPYTQPRDGVSSTDRPNLRTGPGPQSGLPQQQQQPRGLPQQWQNPPQSPHWLSNSAAQSPGLRPPPYNGQFPPPNGQYQQPGHFPPTPPPGPQRMATSSGPYHPGHPHGQQKQISPSSSFQPGFRGPPSLDGRGGGGGQPREGYQPQSRDGGHHHHSGRHHRRRDTNERDRDRDRDRESEKKREVKQKSFKENAKKDVTRGLLGAGAVAGLMDLLGGLDGI